MIDLLPITLGVRSGSDAGGSSFSGSAKIPTEKVLRRDNDACRFCGFTSKKFQRVIPCPSAGTPPFATICTFCEQSVILERAAITGAGLLIWLPEIPQNILNNIARAAYIARSDKKAEPDMAALASRTIDALSARRAEAKKRLGIDDPIHLATLLYESLNDDERDVAVRKLDGIRVLPTEKHWVRGASGDMNQFAVMARYWRSPEGPYAKIPVTQWVDMFKTASSAAGSA
jgi:hypothetical protein